MTPKDFDPGAYVRNLDRKTIRHLTESLADYAESVVRRYRWNTPTGWPEAEQIQDLVADCWEHVLREPCPWDPSRGRWLGSLEKCLLAYLRMNLRRNVQLLWERADMAWRSPLESADGVSAYDRYPNPGPSPEEEFKRSRVRELLRRIAEFLRARSRDLYEIHELWAAGLKPREIAAELGLPDKLVHSRLGELRKIIRRRFRDEYRDVFELPEGLFAGLV